MGLTQSPNRTHNTYDVENRLAHAIPIALIGQRQGAVRASAISLSDARNRFVAGLRFIG